MFAVKENSEMWICKGDGRRLPSDAEKHRHGSFSRAPCSLDFSITKKQRKKRTKRKEEERGFPAIVRRLETKCCRSRNPDGRLKTKGNWALGLRQFRVRLAEFDGSIGSSGILGKV